MQKENAPPTRTNRPQDEAMNVREVEVLVTDVLAQNNAESDEIVSGSPMFSTRDSFQKRLLSKSSAFNVEERGGDAVNDSMERMSVSVITSSCEWRREWMNLIRSGLVLFVFRRFFR